MYISMVCFCVCVCVREKKVLLWNDILRCDCINDGGNVLCCRDAANIKGGLEHLVSSIWHPPFTPKRTHAPTHTLMHVMLFDICIPNETSGMGAEYLQLTGRQRGRKRWLREGSGSSRVLSIFNISFSFIPNPALTRRLFTLFSLSGGHFFLCVCTCLVMDVWKEVIFSSFLPSCQRGTCTQSSAIAEPTGDVLQGPMWKFNGFQGFCRSSL